jgi:glycosyltransferase involved in cell wall biosynthesis
MKPSIKVLHISAPGPSTGAGGAALHLHYALLKRGIDSRIFFLSHDISKFDKAHSYTGSLASKFKRFLVTSLDRILTWRYMRKSKNIFSPGIFGLSLHKHSLFKWADIIHLHWINHGFVQLSELEKLSKSIVWTMHDMWVFTGGCHYSFSCNKFQERCGQCPELNSLIQKDLSYYALKNKMNLIPVKKIKWVAISSWMAEMAKQSSLLINQNPVVINSGINTEIFKNIDKIESRRFFNFPTEKKIILLGAQNLETPTKGLNLSLEAFTKLDEDILVVTFGNGAISDYQVKQKVINMGFINSPEKMAILYSAADIFLATSVAEGFGMTLAEAQSCGIAVVAFNAMGPKDIVDHKITGYLAQLGNVNDIVKGVNYCLTAKLDKANISKLASKFSIEKSADNYIELYESISPNSNTTL